MYAYMSDCSDQLCAPSSCSLNDTVYKDWTIPRPHKFVVRETGSDFLIHMKNNMH